MILNLMSLQEGIEMNRLDFIKDKFFLSDDELDEILHGKDNDSIFALYITAVNFHDYGYYIFLEHKMDMHSKLPNGRKVDGSDCLYQVLLRTPFLRTNSDLFNFIRNVLVLNRNLKEGELL